jgi:hypothetical protein
MSSENKAEDLFNHGAQLFSTHLKKYIELELFHLEWGLPHANVKEETIDKFKFCKISNILLSEQYKQDGKQNKV